MRYREFQIKNYRGIDDITIGVNRRLIPAVGLNESGKSSILYAIAHFDFRNDPETNAWETKNRYQKALRQVATVTAVLDATEEEVIELSAQAGISQEVQDLIFAKREGDRPRTINITRKFASEAGPSPAATYEIEGIDQAVADTVARAIIAHATWIRFINDYLSASNKVTAGGITIAAGFDPAGLDKNQRLIFQVFDASGIALTDYLQITDPDDRKSTLDEVSRQFSKTMINSWDMMHTDLESMKQGSSIRLYMADEGNNGTFLFKVGESVGGQEVTMSIEKRSTGFQWYFYFALFMNYGLGSGDNTSSFLIDEPGSFLHSSAQGVLVQNMQQMVRGNDETFIIFSTHSEHLMDPKVINPNAIYIIQKEGQKIGATTVSQSNHERDRGALSTVFRALQTHGPVLQALGKRVIITEGITDMYFWDSCGLLPDSVVFFPGGSGAGKNNVLISIAAGLGDGYIAIFDGDDAGDKAIKQYKAAFSEDEAVHWLQYKKSDGVKCKLEQLLSTSDEERLKQIASVTDSKKAISALYYSGSEKRKEFWDGIDTVTKANIETNAERFMQAMGIYRGSQVVTPTPASSLAEKG